MELADAVVIFKSIWSVLLPIPTINFIQYFRFELLVYSSEFKRAPTFSILFQLPLNFFLIFRLANWREPALSAGRRRTSATCPSPARARANFAPMIYTNSTEPPATKTKYVLHLISFSKILFEAYLTRYLMSLITLSQLGKRSKIN